jgi:hypothetical protein
MSSMYPSYGGPAAQRCLRCGTPLPPNVVNCMNCGTYNPVAQPGGSAEQGQPPWGSSPAQPSFSSGQHGGPQWEQAPISPSQNNQWGQPAAFPQNNAFDTPRPVSSPSNFYNMPGLGMGQQSNFNNYYVAPQQNAYYSPPSATYEGYSSGSLNGYSPAGYDRPPQKKGGPKVGLIIGIVLLVIVVVGGAFAGFFFLNSHNQNSTATNAMPTVIITPSVTPLISDFFTNNKAGWDLTSNPGKFSVQVGGGSMVLEDDDNKLLWEILPGKSFTDFRLDVNALLSKGDPNNGYGVIIRGASSQASDLATYYRFELYGDGTYAIFKGSMDSTSQAQSSKVQGYTASDAIAKAGRVNHLTIMAKGPSMTLMVNGQTLYTYTDDNYRSGSVALFVSNLPSLPRGAQATFTNLALFPVT